MKKVKMKWKIISLAILGVLIFVAAIMTAHSRGLKKGFDLGIKMAAYATADSAARCGIDMETLDLSDKQSECFGKAFFSDLIEMNLRKADETESKK